LHPLGDAGGDRQRMVRMCQINNAERDRIQTGILKDVDKHAVQHPDDRQLDEDRQTAAQRIDIVLLEKPHLRLGKGGFIAFVLFLEFLDLGLYRRHRLLRLEHLDR